MGFRWVSGVFQVFFRCFFFLGVNPIFQIGDVLAQCLRLPEVKSVASLKVEANVVVDCVEARLYDGVPR